MGQRPGKRVKTRKLRHDDYLVDGPRAADRARDRPDPGPVRVRPGRRPPNGQTWASQSDRVERLNERVGRSQRPGEPTHLTACADRWPGAGHGSAERIRRCGATWPATRSRSPSTARWPSCWKSPRRLAPDAVGRGIASGPETLRIGGLGRQRRLSQPLRVGLPTYALRALVRRHRSYIWTPKTGPPVKLDWWSSKRG